MTISVVKQKAVIKIYFSIEFVKNKMATSFLEKDIEIFNCNNFNKNFKT